MRWWKRESDEILGVGLVAVKDREHWMGSVVLKRKLEEEGKRGEMQGANVDITVDGIEGGSIVETTRRGSSVVLRRLSSRSIWLRRRRVRE